MFTLECPECKKMFQSEQQTYAQRALGKHRTVEHGVLSKSALERVERVKRRQQARQYKTPEPERIAALGRYYRRQSAKQQIQTQTTKTELQNSSWWQAEKNRSITCPCCRAEFIIISGSKQ